MPPTTIEKPASSKPSRSKNEMDVNVLLKNAPHPRVRFIDLFCGIGGLRIAGESLGWECVFSCDIDAEARRAYQANFDEIPHGDVKQIPSDSIPDHDVLMAGFPCQPFSIIGDRLGFVDTRGTLFFEIARILRAKTPPAFILENVKQLAGHNKGATLSRILEVLRGLGYTVEYRILNALDFGLPQKRERIIIAGFYGHHSFNWPTGSVSRKSLKDILEKSVDEKHFASERIIAKRRSAHKSKHRLSIWHENKAGHISSYPFSCALRAGASYNYLLVNGIRRLTPREMLRLQGFPDTFKIVCNDSQTRKQAGNSVPVPVIRAVLENIRTFLDKFAASNATRLPSASR